MMEVEAGTKWIKFNVGQYGYYRGNYLPEQWDSLANVNTNTYHCFYGICHGINCCSILQVLNDEPETLGAMDRASLLNDAFALAEAGRIDYKIPLDMTSYLTRETHLVPWDTIYASLKDLGTKLRNTQV